MLTIGDSLPSLTLQDQAGKSVDTASLAGHVIFFYPKADTPGCTTEACDFRDAEVSLVGAGYKVVGVSPDKPEKQGKFDDKYELGYPLLSDPDHAFAEALGAWGTKKNYGREYEGLIRSTFVVGDDGKIEHEFRNVRAKGHVARVLKALTT